VGVREMRDPQCTHDGDGMRKKRRKTNEDGI